MKSIINYFALLALCTASSIVCGQTADPDPLAGLPKNANEIPGLATFEPASSPANPPTPPLESKSSPSAPEPPSIDPELVRAGATVYARLKREYPDAAMPPDADLAPHTIDMFMMGTIGSVPYLDLSMPVAVWNKLHKRDRDALIALLQSEIQEAKQNPAKFASTSPAAPAYPGEVSNIKSIEDNAWEFNVGHLDAEGYLIEDNAVLRGANYDSTPSNDRPIFVYADSTTDSVYNSHLDGSVSQVKDYHKKHLDDPDSVRYSNWSKVIKTGVGYQVSVTFRSKNGFGGYAVHDQTFTFDLMGAVTEVTNND